MSREKLPGETTFVNTPEWRAAVQAWLDREGVGAQSRLKEQLDLADGTLSKLLSGKIRKSTLIGSISRIAGIPLPRRLSEEVTEISAALAEIRAVDPVAFEALQSLILRHPGVKRTR